MKDANTDILSLEFISTDRVYPKYPVNSIITLPNGYSFVPHLSPYFIEFLTDILKLKLVGMKSFKTSSIQIKLLHEQEYTPFALFRTQCNTLSQC